MAINYLIEIDITKVDGNNRDRETIRLSALSVDPMLFDTFYIARLDRAGLPTIRKSIQNIFYGRSSRNYGSIKMNNSDGRFNYLIRDGWTLSNRPCRVKKGDQSSPYSEYEDYIIGKTGVVSFDSRSITFELADASKDLETIPHKDRENVTKTVQEAIEYIIKTANLTADDSVTAFYGIYGTMPLLLNFKGSKLGQVLDSIITPLRAFYAIDETGKISIKQIKFYSDSDTPIGTLNERKVLPEYTSNYLNRLYWRVKSNYVTTSETKSTSKHTGSDVNGAAVSVSGGDKVGIPVASHSVVAGDSVRIYDDDNYTSEYTVASETTATQIVIETDYVANTFSDAIIRNTVQYPFAQDNYSVGGIFKNEADAETAAELWLDFLKEPIIQYSIRTKTQIFDVSVASIGDHIRLDLPQPYGTIDATIVRLSYSIGSNFILIEAVSR